MKLVYILAVGALAGCTAPEPPSGAQLFAENCTACHGVDGAGTGWVAAGLKRKPANLITLSARNGGAFPMERVLSTIDGFHRNPKFETAMPEFGSWFEGPMDQIELDGVMTPVPQPLLAVAEYLQTLQVE
ncbi:c-type cytochrome [Litoreibacter albidus]|uniref:c-type cytochrome n=1 Tax=Litoreibacter albidus TaxID=670155 RepID=UPI0037350161